MVRCFAISALSMTALVGSCRSTKPIEADSGLTDIAFELPDSNQGKRFNAFGVKITRHGPSVNNTNCRIGEITKAWRMPGSSKTKTLNGTSYKLKNGCTYLLVLDLGFLPEGRTTTTSIDKPMYSNRVVKGGRIVNAGENIPGSKLKGGILPLTVKVFKTENNNNPNDPPELTAPGTADVDITVKFEEGSGAAGTPGPTPPRRVPPLPSLSAISFEAHIKPLAIVFCKNCHTSNRHAAADGEGFWKSKQQSILRRLKDGSMPKTGSGPAFDNYRAIEKTLTSLKSSGNPNYSSLPHTNETARNLLIRYVESL